MVKIYRSTIGLIAMLLSIAQLNAAGDFPVKIVNNTGDPSITVYVLVKGLNPVTEKPAFIRFDTGTGIGQYVDITTPDKIVENPTQSDDAPPVQSLAYGYDYTYFKNANGEYVMHVPYLKSGRVYISLNNKLKMPVVGQAPNLGIADPSAFNPNDPNYDYLYDKVEFTYFMTPTGPLTVINPTAVDCLALPIAVSQDKLVDGKVENVLYGITDSRDKTFNAIENILKASGNSPQWGRLVIRNNQGTILRIVAPGRDDAFFDSTYLNDYINALWSYYTTHTLTIDCTELTNIIPGLGSYTFTGKVIGNDLVFTNATKTYTEKIAKPESKNFFLADQGSFQATNNTVKAVLVRNICSAWSVGLLPVPDGTMLTRTYYLEQKNNHNFYKDNTIIPTTGANKPWYNLYAKAIHSISKDIYAWAYDDAIGLDGTNFSTDKYPATLTIGRMSESSSSAPILPVSPPPVIAPPSATKPTKPKKPKKPKTAQQAMNAIF
jgi:hypothetical protein